MSNGVCFKKIALENRDLLNAALAREAALREELETEKTGAEGIYQQLEFCQKQRDALQQRLTVAEQKLGYAYDWGYSDGQNNPNGYSDKEDRDKCVAELLKPAEEGEGS